MSYTYEPGPANDFLETCVIHLVKALSSVSDCKIFGSTALFVAKKVFGGSDVSRFNYIQTLVTVDQQTYTCQRDFDVLTTKEGEREIKSVLQKRGSLKTYKNIDCKYLYLLRSRGILYIRKIKLDLLSPISSTFMGNLALEHICKLYGSISLNIDIVVCDNMKCPTKFPVPLLSKNFTLTWNRNTESFAFGSLTKAGFHDFTQKKRLENYIEATAYYSMMYNGGAPPNHSRSGDRIIFSREAPPHLKLGENNSLDQSLYKRLRYVLDGRDVLLVNMRRMKMTRKPNVKGTCAFCCENLNSRPIHILKCSHAFHVGCLAEGLRRYYCAVHSAAIQRRGVVIYDLQGNVVASDTYSKCPVCRSPVCEIKVPKEVGKGGWIMSDQDEISTPFE